MPKAKADHAPQKTKDGGYVIQLRVVSSSADGVQYKPYASVFEPAAPLYIQVIVKAEHVVGANGNELVLTPQGWYAIQKQLATASVMIAGVNH